MEFYLYSDHPLLNACLRVRAVNVVLANFWIALENKQIA